MKTARKLRGMVGTWIKLPAIESVQILAHTGWDFVVVDQEHASIDDRTMYELVSMAGAEGLLTLVRVDQLRGPSIQRVLDAGADGVLVPHVDTEEEALQAVRAVRFPPHGSRGAGGTSRAGRWGTLPTSEYLRTGNEDVLMIPQLESRIALENAEAVANTDGVDAIFIGVADLALDMGLSPGSLEVTKLCLAALDTVHRAGKPCGFASGNGLGAAAAFGQGFDFVMASSDTALLATQAANTLTEAKRTQDKH